LKTQTLGLSAAGLKTNYKPAFNNQPYCTVARSVYSKAPDTRSGNRLRKSADPKAVSGFRSRASARKTGAGI